MQPVVGARVRILEPFAFAFPDEYVIATVDEANTCVTLEGVESAFDFQFLEVVG
jgi:hypothetical protein